MKLIKFFLFIFFLFFKCFSLVYASDLTNQLIHFFHKEYHIEEKSIKILTYIPFKKNQFCKNPIFSLMDNVHRFGWINLVFICGSENKYLKVKLQVKGKYVIANKKIVRGTKIKESDLKIKMGFLDALPNGTYFNIKDAINRVNNRDIFPFQPITSFITHPLWLIKANQQVTIRINGLNFEIISIGKALDNGSNREIIRVRMNNGKVIKGIVDSNREVIIIS